MNNKRILPYTTSAQYTALARISEAQAQAILDAMFPAPTEEFLDILMALAEPYTEEELCCICGEFEGQHAHDDACPEAGWYSKTLKFRRA